MFANPWLSRLRGVAPGLAHEKHAPLHFSRRVSHVGMSRAQPWGLTPGSTRSGSGLCCRPLITPGRFRGGAHAIPALTLERRSVEEVTLPSTDDSVTVPDGDLEALRPPSRRVGGFVRRDAPASGLRPTVRFTLALVLTLAWVAFCVWVSEPWRGDLEAALGPVMGWVIPLFLAYIPGFVIGFMIFTLLITRYQALPLEPPSGEWPDGEWPSVTVLVAAWNESEAIVRTLEDIAAMSYAGRVEVVVADNNSTDDTGLVADAAGDRLALHYRRIFEAKQGKHHALNAALRTVTTPIVVTVDADTHPQQQSLTRLVARLDNAPQGQHVSACAAALIADNPMATFVTRMQQWDYRLGINGVKRMQAAYNTALVAQGAFSAYWTSDLRAVGGWPDAIGEDIVLTWAMLASRGLVQYEPLALGFTVVPEQLGRLMSQRSRWARGMLEGLSSKPPPQTTPRSGKAGRRDRLPRPSPRHRRHLLLAAGSHPLPLRLPLDRRLVVDASPSYHPRPLRVHAAMARTPRLPHPRYPPAVATSEVSSATCSPTRCSPPQPLCAGMGNTSPDRTPLEVSDQWAFGRTGSHGGTGIANNRAAACATLNPPQGCGSDRAAECANAAGEIRAQRGPIEKPRKTGVFRSRPVSRILSWVTISLGLRSPGGSSGVPGPSAGRVSGTCFALHRTGFGKPPCRHGRWWALTPPFHPYRRFPAGGLLSVPLSVGFRRLGFPQRPALRCPDFPRTLEAPAVTRPAPLTVALPCPLGGWPACPRVPQTGRLGHARSTRLSLRRQAARAPGQRRRPRGSCGTRGRRSRA